MSPALQALLHSGVMPGAAIIAFMWPTQIVRVLRTDESGKTFRVEQIVEASGTEEAPQGRWRALTTHTNATTPWGAYPVALNAAKAAQNKLVGLAHERVARRENVV